MHHTQQRGDTQGTYAETDSKKVVTDCKRLYKTDTSPTVCIYNGAKHTEIHFLVYMLERSRMAPARFIVTCISSNNLKLVVNLATDWLSIL